MTWLEPTMACPVHQSDARAVSTLCLSPDDLLLYCTCTCRFSFLLSRAVTRALHASVPSMIYRMSYRMSYRLLVGAQERLLARIEKQRTTSASLEAQVESLKVQALEAHAHGTLHERTRGMMIGIDGRLDGRLESRLEGSERTGMHTGGRPRRSSFGSFSVQLLRFSGSVHGTRASSVHGTRASSVHGGSAVDSSPLGRAVVNISGSPSGQRKRHLSARTEALAAAGSSAMASVFSTSRPREVQREDGAPSSSQKPCMWDDDRSGVCA